MPYPAHTLVTVGGTLNEKAAGDEIWQIGIRGFADGGGPVAPSALHDLATLILRGPTGDGGGVQALFGRADGYCGGIARLTWAKAANIGPDGKYTAEPGISQFAGVAGPAPSKAPSFCCVALSFGTGLTLGKAVRGRVYPPNFGAPLDNGATITPAAQADLLTWAFDLLRAFDTSLESVPFHPYVISSSGASHPITSVRVGNVYDTQRRRKDAVAETYVSEAFTP